jgi:phenylpyruvate tautomerase PptA (4-oxalocrotonate tautomerase family)
MMSKVAGGVSRREILATATVAAGVLAGGGETVAQTIPSGFGAPLVELHVPAGILSLEQREAMIKGVTDVVLTALHQPLDPAKRLFVEILETAEGGYGVNGHAFVPRGK